MGGGGGRFFFCFVLLMAGTLWLRQENYLSMGLMEVVV